MPFLPQYGSAASVIVYGAATAPAAGATIVTLASALSAGLWQIETVTHMWGSLGGAVDNNNMQITGVTGGPYTLNADAGTGTQVNHTSAIYSMDGSQIVAVKAVGNASAGTTYSCKLICTKLPGQLPSTGGG